MAPETQAVVLATQAWLRTSWHIQVPFPWLEACVEWLQEEAGGAGRLSQHQTNQQALDQWLLTDLRDLDYPVLPEGLAQAQKTELSGIYCVQVDSLLDISQPAYGQLQKLRGTDCANDEVSAVTQATQRPWEARTTRLLLLQVTDGVQSLEAMEYQSIPALTADLRPGVKLQLQGQMVCRLGVLLLGPSNIKVLGGEVEDLVDRNNQGRMLCRTLGLPEQQQGEREGAPSAPQQGNQAVEDLEVDDAELLASLEAQEEVERLQVGPGQDSGYRTLSEASTQPLRSSSVRNSVSTASYRSEASVHSYRSGLTQSDGHGSIQGHRHNEGDSDLVLSNRLIQQDQDEDFPDEDFDDLPLDELDAVIYQESVNAADSSRSGITGNPIRVTKPQTPHSEQYAQLATATSAPSHQSECVTNDGNDFMDEDMDSFFEEALTGETGGPNQLHDQQGSAQGDPQSHGSPPALTLTSPPFTYLHLLEELMSKPDPRTTEIRVKAFIVTLLGKLSTNNGLWRVCATISDGTGYLDVELSNEVLTCLLGFSVAEKGALKRDPARRSELEAGMRRCQEELVDMCCVMNVTVQPEGGKAVVTKVEPVNEKVLRELEQRVRK